MKRAELIEKYKKNIQKFEASKAIVSGMDSALAVIDAKIAAYKIVIEDLSHPDKDIFPTDEEIEKQARITLPTKSPPKTGKEANENLEQSFRIDSYEIGARWMREHIKKQL